MSMYVPNVGKEYLLNQMVAPAVSDAWKIGLFSNSPTITDATVLGDLTACTFAGYAAVSLGVFNAAAIDGSNRAFSSPTTNTATFTRSTTGTLQNAVGYYVFTGSTLIGAEVFSSPYPFQTAGDSLTLPFTLRDQAGAL